MDETEKVGGLDNLLINVYSYTLIGTPIRIIHDRSEVEHWPADIAVSSSRPLVAEIFPIVNETSLYTSFHYYPLIILI